MLCHRHITIGIMFTLLGSTLSLAIKQHTHGHARHHRHHERATNQVYHASNSSTVGLHNGIGSGLDNYTFYRGDGSSAMGWPSLSQWVSFEEMFYANVPLMEESWPNLVNGIAATTTPEMEQILSAIQWSAYQTKVDNRFILAIIMQESKGCVRVNTTGTEVKNPGLMQDHSGAHSCNADGKVMTPCPDGQIFGMIEDGVAGTSAGDGLAGTLNLAGTDGEFAQLYYRAARLYNSGTMNKRALEQAFHATPCYASDVANRLTGWISANSTCPELGV